jgi:hypothetical protein
MFAEAMDWARPAGCLAPLLSCMFDGAEDDSNHQMKMFLGSRYVQVQISLAVASDDMDNATNGNVENLKAEAGTLIQTHKAEMAKVSGGVAGGWGSLAAEVGSALRYCVFEKSLKNTITQDRPPRPPAPRLGT